MKVSNTRTLILAVTITLLAGCGTTKIVQNWESDSIEPEVPEKLAVLVVWPDQLQRLSVERDMVRQLRDKGTNAVESSEIPGMRGELTAQAAEKALRNANADAVLIVFIVGGGGGATYERSDYWLQNVGSGVGGWYAPHFYDVYTVREGPGFAEQTTELYLETTYIDVRRIERVWSFVTKSEEVEYQDVAARLTDRIITQMRRSDQM
jgi:hypothetical protein